MNKYQEFALKNTRYVIYEDEQLKRNLSGDGWLCIADGLVINQKEDYNITKYFIRIDGSSIKSVSFNGKEYGMQEVNNSSHPSAVIPVDFNNKVEELTINYNVVDSIKIKIQYVDADKKAFDDKVAKENQDKLEQKACIQISTGNDLVNIYFQPCNDSYDKTYIDLYLANGNYSHAPSVMGKHDVFIPQLLSATPGQLIGKFETDNGMLFKSITGLAHHAYAVKVKQLDKEGNTLFETDYKYFDIR